MGGFCVKRCDSSGYYCSLISPDLNVTHNIKLSFLKGDATLHGASCGDVLYFFDLRGRTFIYNNLDGSKIYVGPPKEFIRDYGLYLSCGVCYDAKSKEYKVVRIYSNIVKNEAMKEVSKCYFDLYSVLTQSAKNITEPARECFVLGTNVYIGEAGSGSGSCYWTATLSDDDASSDDPLMGHVLSFDFATESFDQFPLPATAKVNSPSFHLVEYRGMLGLLVYWHPPDEFCLDPHQPSSDLSVQLFRWNGKGTSWDLLYDVSVADAYRPLGLRDRLLFVAAGPHHGCYELMVYNLASRMLKKLGIDDCKLCGFSYGEGKKKKKKKKKNKNKKKKMKKMNNNNNKGKGEGKKEKGK